MARSLEQLQKQYNFASSSQNNKGMPPMGGPGPGRHGPRGMAKGKPKNTKNTIIRMFKYVEKYKFRLIGVIFLMLTSTVTSLIGSFMLAPIINKITLFVAPLDASEMSLMERFSDSAISKFRDTFLSGLNAAAGENSMQSVMVYILGALIILLTVVLSLHILGVFTIPAPLTVLILCLVYASMGAGLFV